MDLKNCIVYQTLLERNSPYLENIKKLFQYADNTLPKIENVFSSYTGHGIKHSLNVMGYMCNLCNNIKQLSDLEIVVFFYVAMLHDIGMVVTNEEIVNIKNDNSEICERKYSAVLKKFNNEFVALEECVRPIHGKRSKQHIMNMNVEFFLVPGYTSINFQGEVADICMAHNENFEWISENLKIENVKGSDNFNSQYIAMLLRLADYLDIDEERAPLYLYRLINPYGYGDREWQQHYIVNNKEKIITNTETDYKEFQFYGQSKNPNIHRKFLKYVELIAEELRVAIVHANKNFNSKYILNINPIIKNEVQTVDFDISTLKLSLNYNAIFKLLMGQNIYGNCKYGMRELIQNAIDACKVMHEKSKNCEEFKYQSYQPSIQVIFDKDRNKVIIKDNGCGMSYNVLVNYFLSIGSSFYTSDEYILNGNTYNPIGNYGIGFLSCFMLSDNIIVETKAFRNQQCYIIELESESEYICVRNTEDGRQQGTSIILDYNSTLNCFNNSVNEVKEFIYSNFMDCNIPLEILTVENSKVRKRLIKLLDYDHLDNNYIILDNYLKGVKVAVLGNFRKIKFDHNLSEIISMPPFISGDSYIYDQDKGMLIKKELEDITEYITNNTIVFCNYKILDNKNKNKYLEVIDLLNDKYTAQRKFCNNICVPIKDGPIKLKDLLKKSTGYMSFSDSSVKILDNANDTIQSLGFINKDYTYENFCNDTGQCKDIICEYEIVTANIIHEVNTLLEFINEPISTRHNEDYCKIYVRNILVSKENIEIPTHAVGIEDLGYIVNILDSTVIPNISRDKICSEDNEQLSYAIGKAIHLWVLDNINLQQDEKKSLEKFISEYYSEINKFLKG